MNRFAAEVHVSDYAEGLLHFSMSRITVDGIESSYGSCFQNLMFAFKEDEAWSGMYQYEDDGYPIDEELYLKTGEILSTNPRFEESRRYVRDLLAAGYYNS